MGRRSEHSPEHLRELIISASETIIADHGLIGLSAREIAKAVGYSPGTIYNIFDSLDDLILQIEGRMLDSLDARLDQVSSNGTPETRLHQLAAAYMQFTAERPRLWNLLFEHHLPKGVEIPHWYQEKLGRLLGRVETAIMPFMKGSDSAAVARSAHVLWASVHGITSLATADKLSSITTETAHVLVDDLVSNYIAGLNRSRQAA